jgi:hypothetical protein
MEAILIILIGLAGGVAVGLQGPLASLLTQKLGVFESVFIVHLGGAVIALIPLLFYGGGKISQWRNVPLYALGAGVFGLVVIAAVSYMIPRVGGRRRDHDDRRGAVIGERAPRPLRLARRGGQVTGCDAPGWVGGCPVWGLVDGEVTCLRHVTLRGVSCREGSPKQW